MCISIGRWCAKIGRGDSTYKLHHYIITRLTSSSSIFKPLLLTRFFFIPYCLSESWMIIISIVCWFKHSKVPSRELTLTLLEMFYTSQLISTVLIPFPSKLCLNFKTMKFILSFNCLVKDSFGSWEVEGKRQSVWLEF